MLYEKTLEADLNRNVNMVSIDEKKGVFIEGSYYGY